MQASTHRAVETPLWALAVLLTVAVAGAQQAPTAEPKPKPPASPPSATGKAKPKPQAAGKAKPKPQAAAVEAEAAPKPAAPAAQKGFTRIQVTEEVKNTFEAETRVAVLVAPSYRNSGLDNLRFTYNDMLGLRAELERQKYIVYMVAPAEASADSVRKKVAEARQNFAGTSQGTLLFAFSGHGFQDAQGKNYLMTLGVTEKEIEQALPLDEVQQLMNATGARRKIVLVDACRNDPERKSAGDPASFAQFLEAEGMAVLLSTRPGGFSYEDPGVDHGIFTHHLLEGLRGKAANKDGYVTFHDLQGYLRTAVPMHASRLSRVQQPFMLGERSGDFLLATVAPPKPEEMEKTKPPAMASRVDADAPTLWGVGQVGSRVRPYYALLRDGTLTLVDGESFAAIVVMAEVPVAKNAKEGYRRFEGRAPGKEEVYHAAVWTKGDEVLGIKARVGLPCPTPVACTAPERFDHWLTDVGEEPNVAGKVADRAKDTAKRTGKVLESVGWGRKGKERAGQVEVAAGEAKEAIDKGNKLLMYTWRSFELTSTLPEQAKR